MKNIFIITFLSIGILGCSVTNQTTKQTTNHSPTVSVLKNGNFKTKLDKWGFWGNADNYSNKVSILVSDGKQGKYNFLRIENPYKNLIGVQQLANVSSGSVYRLSGSARSTVTNNSSIIFGGRIGFYLPPQKEKQIVWTSEFNNWWRKELIFTNTVNGIATIYVHMGYGNVSSTGEFAGITLEEI